MTVAARPGRSPDVNETLPPVPTPVPWPPPSAGYAPEEVSGPTGARRFEQTIVEVLTRGDDRAALEQIAGSLLDLGLIAVAHLRGPFTSQYVWNGERVTADEWELVLTTSGERAAAVACHVEDRHPYDLPSVRVTVVRTSDAYASWVAAPPAG